MNDSTKKEEMKPLSEVMNMLKNDGYTEEFRMGEKGLCSPSSEKEYSADELKIKKMYRFEGESDPGDESVLYAVETNDAKKGIMLDAYGTYSDTKFYEFIKNVEEDCN